MGNFSAICGISWGVFGCLRKKRWAKSSARWGDQGGKLGDIGGELIDGCPMAEINAALAGERCAAAYPALTWKLP